MNKIKISVLCCYVSYFTLTYSQDRSIEGDILNLNRQELHLLDFWVGHWDVYSGNTKIGTNRVEKILKGAAITETWISESGCSEGRSLFYYHPQKRLWKQVWVTDNPSSAGSVKEKQYIETLDNGAVRFQGELSDADGTSYLDRTTLIPLDNGNILQLIEIRPADLDAWREVFKGEYKPSELRE